MHTVEITPSQFHCHDHQQEDLTELVKEELELRTAAAFPATGSKDFRVIVTCPGAGTEHEVVCSGTVTALQKADGHFVGVVAAEDGREEIVRSRRVLLATGAVDVEPGLPDLPNAVQRGLVRYCPICDGYEAAGKAIAVGSTCGTIL